MNDQTVIWVLVASNIIAFLGVCVMHKLLGLQAEIVHDSTSTAELLKEQNKALLNHIRDIEGYKEFLEDILRKQAQTK